MSRISATRFAVERSAETADLRTNKLLLRSAAVSAKECFLHIPTPAVTFSASRDGSSGEGVDEMLVLTRKIGEEIIIGGCIRVKVADIRGSRVRLAIEAPRDLSVQRSEIADALREQLGIFVEPAAHAAPVPA
jgi:carbon storage regulator